MLHLPQAGGRWASGSHDTIRYSACRQFNVYKLTLRTGSNYFEYHNVTF